MITAQLEICRHPRLKRQHEPAVLVAIFVTDIRFIIVPSTCNPVVSANIPNIGAMDRLHDFTSILVCEAKADCRDLIETGGDSDDVFAQQIK